MSQDTFQFWVHNDSDDEQDSSDPVASVVTAAAPVVTPPVPAAISLPPTAAVTILVNPVDAVNQCLSMKRPNSANNADIMSKKICDAWALLALPTSSSSSAAPAEPCVASNTTDVASGSPPQPSRI